MLRQEILCESSILGDPDERFCPNPIIMDQNPEMKNLLQTVTPVLTNGVMQVVLLGTVKIRKSKHFAVKEKFFEILLYLESQQKAKEANEVKTKEADDNSEKEKKTRQKTSKQIRACFGPAKDCTNCKSKGAELMQFPPNDEDNVLQPGAKQINSFKRCSACHVVAYCSEVIHTRLLRCNSPFNCNTVFPVHLLMPSFVRTARENIGSTTTKSCAKFCPTRKNLGGASTRRKTASPAAVKSLRIGST